MLVRSLIVGCLLLTAVAAPGLGQRPRHYFHSADLPPGTVGQGQLLHVPTLHNYIQPIELQVPDGATISVKNEGSFTAPQAGPLLVGMQVGQVYELKVTNIPLNEGQEVFPTVEIINRLYPPEGQKLRFAVPVQFTKEELELALTGRFVTRVIYLEDPRSALPRAQDAKLQRYFEVAPNEDPLFVADTLGRPMAILRMGSRIPDAEQAMAYQPPVIIYPRPSERPLGGSPADAIERQGRNFPRLPQNGQPLRAAYPAPAPSLR